MRTSETVTVLRAAFVLVFATLTAWAQSTAADIVGTVTDPSGAVVSNVLVKVTQEETNFSRETHSNSEGIYEFRILQPGTYTVTAEATGFKKYVNGHIPLAPRQVLRIDIPIAIGNLADTINVVAEAPVTNTEMGTVAESRNSMLLSRGPQGTLVMGTFGYNTSKYSLLLRDGGWTEASFKADGSHARQWQASIDGNAAETAYPGLGIPYQAVSDENVTVVNASAEFRTPVTIDAVTKGGTNQLHGSYTWGLGHQALNALAASASTSRRGPQRPSHNWNLTSGGPLYIPKVYDGRNRTFWFISMERNPPSNSTSLNSQAARAFNVPTSAMRQGDFSSYFAATGRAARQLIDPLSGLAFAGNVIPRSRWNPAAVNAVDKFYPAPNIASANPNIPYANADAPFYSSGSVHQLFIRLDQKITGKNTFGFTYDERPNASIFSEGTPYGTLPATLEGLDKASQYAGPRQFGWNDTHIFSPTIVNEVRVGYYIQTQNRNVNHKLAGAITDALAIDLGADADARKKLRQAPNINITGYDKIGSVYSADDIRTEWWQLRDNLSIQRGRHSFKLGYDHRFKFADQSNTNGSGVGTWNFTGRFTGEAFADFVLGLPDSTARYTPSLPIRIQRYNELGLYVQDDFKATPRLTLNIGLRFDRISPRREIQGTYYNFDPQNGALVFPDQKSMDLINPAFPKTIKRELASQSGFPATLMNATLAFSPRFGFAYRLDSTGRTVVRGGYSIFQVDSGWLNGDFRVLQTGGPFALTENFVNTITDGVPLVTLDRPFPTNLGGAPSSISVTGLNPNLGVPMMQQWNLTLERQIHGNWAGRLSYVGSHNTQLGYQRDINRPPASLIPFTSNRLLYPGYQTISYIDKGASATYHAMQLGFSHRYANGLLVDALFQWINEISDASEGGSGGIDTAFATIENPYCRRCEMAKSFVDTLDFRANFIYELPIGRGKPFGANLNRVVNGFLGGWSISGSPDIRNGRPETVVFSGRDTSNTNLRSGRADVLPGCNVRPSDGKSGPYLNIACFAFPQNGTFGNANRALYRKPGSWDVSGAIYKYFPLYKERARLRINAVFSNAFNHPTWNTVGNDITIPAGFGKLSGQGAFGRVAGPRGIRLQGQIEW